jgi:intein/homing endonuclease
MLPYVKKALLTRCLIRSNVENIKEGCVYPNQATRCHCHMPDSFPLDEEFGTFVGIYLADGCSHIKSGHVGISKEDPEVLEWVAKWCKKHEITTNVKVEKKLRGTSTTIECRSTLLARFLDGFVGHGAGNKHIPNEAYAAPEAFLRGLLSGYISGDGSVGKDCITTSTISPVMNEGMAWICTRLGVFAKMSVRIPTHEGALPNAKPNHTLSIRAQWGTLLAGKLALVHAGKVAAKEAMRCAASHANYKAQEDVVMDAIKSIEEIDSAAHPKLYDVTVPSTLNFCLANGLNSRDTSETGYLQRRLVKAMEDCKIHHDGTVRNANNYIVQFLYGEDGMDAIKLEHHKMPYLDKEVSEMAKEFLVADAQLELGLAEQASEADHAAFAEHFKALLADRQWVVRTLCGGQQRYEKLVHPVHIERIIAMVADAQPKGAAAEDPLDPMRVLEAIKELTAELRPRHARNIGTDSWMGVLLRCFLSPKRLMLKYRISASSFARITDTIRRDYWASFAHAGEMVGIVAAQSIGEISTQLTLNSVDWRTELLLSVDSASELKRVKIGAFIDAAIKAAKAEDLEHHDGGRTTLAWINRPGMPVTRILAPDENGKVAWQVVEAVTQHPPINEDGSSTLLKVTTATGREVIATKAKSFLTRKGNKLVASRGDELRIGDYLPVSDVLPLPASHQSPPESLPGAFGRATKDGRVAVEMLGAPEEWRKSFVEGYFSVHSTSRRRDRAVVEDVSNILLTLGVRSRVRRDLTLEQMVVPSAKDMDVVPGIALEGEGEGISLTKAEIRERLASDATSEADRAVLSAALHQDVFYDRVVCIEEVASPYEFVYDLTVANTRTFQTYHGL